MAKIFGAYYLHTNGDLIWKLEAAFKNTSVEAYMDSPFVVKYWVMPIDPPAKTPKDIVKWMMDWLREAYELSSDKERTEKGIRHVCFQNQFPIEIVFAIIEGKKGG